MLYVERGFLYFFVCRATMLVFVLLVTSCCLVSGVLAFIVARLFVLLCVSMLCCGNDCFLEDVLLVAVVVVGVLCFSVC